MGFYFRKSVKLGPFRLNFSKSGVGMSLGVKGMRIGKGPQGNYIHMTGPMGIQYRQSLNGGKKQSRQKSTQTQVAPENVEWIDSGDVDAMRDISFDNILNEINMKYARPTAWWFLIFISPLVAIVVYSIFAGNNIAGAAGFAWLSIPFMIILSILLRAAEIKGKTTYLIYGIDTAREEKIQKWYDALDELKNCAMKWHVMGQSDLAGNQFKNAGAEKAVHITPILIADGTPKYIKANVKALAVPAGNQILYFFPDRVLVVEKQKVGTVKYADLAIEYKNEPTLEVGVVPPDARVIEQVWKYAKKNGDPDLRYKDNVQFPVCDYSVITFSSNSGLHERIMVSKPDFGASLVEALNP
jgi:hypothetical protein